MPLPVSPVENGENLLTVFREAGQSASGSIYAVRPITADRVRFAALVVVTGILSFRLTQTLAFQDH